MQSAKHYTLVLTCLINTMLLQAQFEGINSFFNDTALLVKIKANKIRSVQEFILQNGNKRLTTKFYFNTDGKVSDMFTFDGTGISRKHFEYNKAGYITLEQSYKEGDTTQINSTQLLQYSPNGELLSKQIRYTLDNKQVEETELSSKKLVTSSTKTIVEAAEFYQSNKTGRIVYIDSLDGDNFYRCVYRFREGDTDEKGRIHGRKTIQISRMQGNTMFDDQVEFEVYGKTESPKDIKSTYYEYDNNKKMLEFGALNFEDAYAQYLQLNPDNFNPYQVSPSFVAAFFKNEVKGQKRADAKFTYNKKGQLTSKLLYGLIYTFEYDSKGNIIAYTAGGEHADYGKSNYNLAYNAQGLVSKIISESSPPEGSGAVAEKQELTYIYGH